MERIPAEVSNFLQHFFDKILVVSVHRFTDRHEAVQKNLEGLPFEFYWGADKLQITMDSVKQDGLYDEEKAVELHRLNKPLHLGEIACAISHRNVYAAMIRHNWKRVLILEDDVLPIYDKLHLLPLALQELPEGWELLYLGYLKHEKVTTPLKLKQAFYKVLSSIGLMKWNYTMVSNLLPKPFSTHLKKAGFHDCTHAYAITLEAAKKLLSAQSPVVYRADDLISYTILKGGFTGLVTEPKFFDQADYHSTHRSKIKAD